MGYEYLTYFIYMFFNLSYMPGKWEFFLIFWFIKVHLKYKFGNYLYLETVQNNLSRIVIVMLFQIHT